MPLTAKCVATGAVVEAFSASEDEWRAIRNAKLGLYTMRRTGAPAIPKQNMYGTRWFQSAPGFCDPNWKPESPEHEMAKVWMVRALRKAGYEAYVEKFGQTAEGETWEADVWVSVGNRAIAIEVQISSQSFEDYLRRTERYTCSGVKVAWLINNRHYKKFSIAAMYRKGWHPNGAGMYPDMLDVPAFPLEMLFPKGKPVFEKMNVMVRPPDAWPTYPISVSDFALVLAEGVLRFRDKNHWVLSR